MTNDFESAAKFCAAFDEVNSYSESIRLQQHRQRAVMQR